MTENQLRNKAVARAESWLSRCEADGSHREILDVYNAIVPLPRGYRMSDGDPWCAAFVSAVGAACGLTGIVYPECSCPKMLELYQKAGRWEENDAYLPRPGDLIFYDWQDGGEGDNVGAPDHVGLVTAADSRQITVIEGNCGNAVRRLYRQPDSRGIRGFGLPDYASAAAENSEFGIQNSELEKESAGADAPVGPSPSPSGGRWPSEARSDEGELASPSVCALRLPLLRIGDENGWVKGIQTLLIERGYDCGNRRLFGREKPDGEFGQSTRGAVAALQRSCALDPDGEVGGSTWAALLSDWR